MKLQNWWWPLVAVFVLGGAGVLFMGIRTYQDAPPIPTFVDEEQRVVADSETILRGQSVFQKHALMEYGSMFGDGGGRGPDFTADALHRTALSMLATYEGMGDPPAVARERVQKELKRNRYDKSANTVTLSPAATKAHAALAGHYLAAFAGKGSEPLQPSHWITDPAEIRDLSTFLFWGGWVCAAQRPGQTYSYTHNWPYDPVAGNTPSSPVYVWTFVGSLALVLGVGVVLWLNGRFAQLAAFGVTRSRPVQTAASVAGFRPTPAQRASYKFFATAAVLFLVQVLAGILTVHDFVRFTHFFGVDLSAWLPLTVTRSWHLLLSLFWISACWIGGSIFVLPLLAGSEPPQQKRIVDALYWLLVLIVGGSVAGTLLGPAGLLGDWWRMLGHQGWEFVEFGRIWHGLLIVALALWGLIVLRGLWPVLTGKALWTLPWWLIGSILAILGLSLAGFVAGPRTNFVIADFWRWMVIHMWVEAFFELFTTALVAAFMVIMGLANLHSAARAVYIGALLFLGSGILGISHNFYWNAKPVETLAIGSVFSTLQIVPLILLTVDAWRTSRMPETALREDGAPANAFGQTDAFRFLLAVGFWNFLGAGVFGFVINLPIANYYEHGTYLTVNHGHAALMGVYGNLALAAILFCVRHLLPAAHWNATLLRIAFWSLNLGLMLMVLLDTLPLGLVQIEKVVSEGYFAARSQEFVLGETFQALTWMRLIGGAIFVLGGVLPVAWFLVSRARALKPAVLQPEPIVERAPEAVAPEVS